MVVIWFRGMFRIGSSATERGSLHRELGSILSENMEMKTGGPTIIARCLTIRDVYEDELSVFGDALTGADVVKCAEWLEIHGDTETLKLEYWKRIAPNIWRVMLPKS